MATAILNPIFDSLNGTVGRMVFYKRYGRTIMRMWIMPPNPNTPAQSKNRDRFRQAMASWRALPDYEKDSYNRRATKLSMTGHNLYISRFMKGQTAKDRENGGYMGEFSPKSTRNGMFALSNGCIPGDFAQGDFTLSGEFTTENTAAVRFTLSKKFAGRDNPALSNDAASRGIALSRGFNPVKKVALSGYFVLSNASDTLHGLYRSVTAPSPPVYGPFPHTIASGKPSG
ncbi:MAG TPA: hypothetical protein PK573_14765 [Spirochaetota bacterium]|nr:hypothetical protein [Spirochaetota bacterium]HRZ29083.1 hypothetical protein [Spirochaetota bacterium]